MAEFVHWVHRPSIGDRLVRTRELLDAPYAVMLIHDGGDMTTDRLLADVRSTIQWNTGRGSTARAQAIAGPLVRRARRKLRWLAASRFGRRATTASRVGVISFRLRIDVVGAGREVTSHGAGGPRRTSRR